MTGAEAFQSKTSKEDIQVLTTQKASITPEKIVVTGGSGLQGTELKSAQIVSESKSPSIEL